MKKVFGVTLGVLTAMGGFVDIGDIVANSETGARFGMLGLSIIVLIVALVQLHPSWSHLWHQASHPGVPHGEGHATYFYFAIALFGAAMTPYEVFFFSSGAVEEKWSKEDLGLNRANVFLGFPLGGALSLSLMALAAVVFAPASVSVDHLSQLGIPVAMSVGKIGLAL